MLQVLTEVAARYRRYESTGVSRQIAEHDAMFSGNMDHYLRVGRSAIEIVASAMIAVRKSAITNVLDLPCGAGRVTRHLRAFFPDADLYVSDLDKRGEHFAAETFRATPIAASPTFSVPLPRTFELIFCGSLLTHLAERPFVRALDWLCGALAPDGLLLLTVHGRRADYAERNLNRYIDPAKWTRVREAAQNGGFGFVETEQVNGAPYGVSLVAPSWIMRNVEHRPVRIVNYQEAGWSDHHDVLVLHNRPIE